MNPNLPEPTPGPWTLKTVKTSIGVCHQIGKLGSSTKIHHACLYDDCYSVEPRDLQLLADARLIAAAPELLEALRQIHSCTDVDHFTNAGGPAKAKRNIRQIAESAIAKIEGRAA